MLQSADGRLADLSERSRELTLSSDRKRQQLQRIGVDATEKKEMMMTMLRNQTDVTNATSNKVRSLLKHLDTVNHLQAIDPSSGITFENRIKFLEVELHSERQSNLVMVRELQEQHNTAIATLGNQISNSSARLAEESYKTKELIQSLAVITSHNTELSDSQSAMEVQISDLIKEITFMKSENSNLKGSLDVSYRKIEAAMTMESFSLVEKETTSRESLINEINFLLESERTQISMKRTTEMEERETILLEDMNSLKDDVNEISIKNDSLQEEIASLRSARQEAETRCMLLETSVSEKVNKISLLENSQQEQLSSIKTLKDHFNDHVSSHEEVIFEKESLITLLTQEKTSLKEDLSNYETIKKEGDEYITQLRQSVSELESRNQKQEELVSFLQTQFSQQNAKSAADANQVQVLTALQTSLSEKLISSIKEKDEIESKNCEIQRDVETLRTQQLEKDEEVQELQKALLMSQRLNTAKDNMIEQADSEAAAARQTLCEWNAQQVLNQVDDVKSPQTLDVSEDSKQSDEDISPADLDEIAAERQQFSRQQRFTAAVCDEEVMATPISQEGDYDEGFVPCSPLIDENEIVRISPININQQPQPDSSYNRPSEIYVTAQYGEDLGITHYGCNIILVTEGSLADIAGVRNGMWTCYYLLCTRQSCSCFPN